MAVAIFASSGRIAISAFCGGSTVDLLVYKEARPRIISDNGPQFIAKDFKEFIRISGMTHVRTSPYYPQ